MANSTTVPAPSRKADGLTDSPAVGAHRGWTLTRVLLHLLGPVATLALLVPMVTQGQFYIFDWQNHLFLINQQAASIRQFGHPTYFLNTALTGGYTPFYMFYGGTLYAVAGTLAVVLGSTFAAYIAMFAAGAAMAYAGSWWLGHQLGLDSLLAHLPACVTVTGAFYVSNLYGLGHWPEFMAISSMPPLVAAALACSREPAPHLWQLAVLFGATVLFTGSHNITALWGAIFLLGVLVVVGTATRAWCARVPGRRGLLLATVCALGVGVNLWFLLPDLLYSKHTAVYQGLLAGTFNPQNNRDLGEPWALFNPGRNDFSHFEGVYVQAPVYALLWSLLAFGVPWRRHSTVLRRVGVGLIALLVLLSLLFCFASLWDVLPAALKAIQSPERLSSYITLGTVGLFVVALLGTRRLPHRRRWLAGALVAALVQVGLAEYQVRDHNEGWGPVSRITADAYAPSLDLTLAHAQRDYRWDTGPVVQADQGAKLTPAQRELAGGQATVFVAAPAVDADEDGASLYSTTVAYSPMLRVNGDAYIAGRDADGLAVVRLLGHPKRWKVTFTTGHTAPMKLGLLLTALSLVLALLGAAALLLRGLPELGRFAYQP